MFSLNQIFDVVLPNLRCDSIRYISPFSAKIYGTNFQFLAVVPRQSLVILEKTAFRIFLFLKPLGIDLSIHKEKL